MTREQAATELHDLMHGKNRWFYAFAMGHGCTTEDNNSEISRAVRERDAYLRGILEREGRP